MYDMIEQMVGSGAADVVSYSLSAILVLIGLFLIYLLVKFIRRPRFAGGKRSKQARLAITDAAAIDERRRLVLVRRDEVEHLILIGGTNDVVIESDIRRHASTRAMPTAQNAPIRQSAPAQPQPVAASPAPTSQPTHAVAIPAPVQSAAVAPTQVGMTAQPRITPQPPTPVMKQHEPAPAFENSVASVAAPVVVAAAAVAAVEIEPPTTPSKAITDPIDELVANLAAPDISVPAAAPPAPAPKAAPAPVPTGAAPVPPKTENVVVSAEGPPVAPEPALAAAPTLPKPEPVPKKETSVIEEMDALLSEMSQSK